MNDFIYDIFDESRLYNLHVSYGEKWNGFGQVYKLKRTPWAYRFPRLTYDGTADHRKMRWSYKPWHRYRVSPGEAQNYTGGFTIRQAIRNMIKSYGIGKVIKIAKDNGKYDTMK